MTITELAIKRPSLIVVIFLALGILGLFGYFQDAREIAGSIGVNGNLKVYHFRESKSVPPRGGFGSIELTHHLLCS